MNLFRRIRLEIALYRARSAEARWDLAAAATLYREAERHAEAFTKAAILNKLGMLAYNLGDLRGARARYQEALAVEPEAYAIHMNLGNALHDLGEHDAARRSLRPGPRAQEAAGRAL